MSLQRRLTRQTARLILVVAYKLNQEVTPIKLDACQRDEAKQTQGAKGAKKQKELEQQPGC